MRKTMKTLISPFEICFLLMSGGVPDSIGKVFHKVLLKVPEIFFTEPCILK